MRSICCMAEEEDFATGRTIRRARFAESGPLLVMPEGGSSYYTNAVDPPRDRYEDHITRDLIANVETRFPAASGRANRAIMGVSMGGFGAVTLALRHPDRFGFVGGISSAIDVPRRAFTIKRFQQSRHYNSIFGPSGSQTRRDSDPFVLIRTANPEAAPYFLLTCGEQEGLMPANREFARCSGRVTSGSSFTPSTEVTTGTSGMHGSPPSSVVSQTIGTRRVDHRRC